MSSTSARTATVSHHSLPALCGNTAIHRLLEAIHNKVLAIKALYWHSGNKAEKAPKGREGILRAIRGRDVLVAKAQLRIHVRQAVALLRPQDGEGTGEHRAPDMARQAG